MSCFIMNPRTIARIANYICAHINGGYNTTHLPLEISNEFKRLVSIDGIANEEKTYKELYKLNYEAFNTRYEGRHTEDLADNLDKYAEYDNPLIGLFDHEINANHYQMFKSIECYLYQCSESEELENSIVYKEVSRLKNAIMSKIVHRSAEYQAADWD